MRNKRQPNGNGENGGVRTERILHPANLLRPKVSRHGARGHAAENLFAIGRVVRLRISEPAVVQAREELLTYDLLAYQPPLTQVLSLPTARLERKDCHALRALWESQQAPGGTP